MPAEGQALEATHRGMTIVVGCGMYAGCGGVKNMKQGENRKELAGRVGHKSVGMKSCWSQETHRSRNAGRRLWGELAI